MIALGAVCNSARMVHPETRQPDPYRWSYEWAAIEQSWRPDQATGRIPPPRLHEVLNVCVSPETFCRLGRDPELKTGGTGKNAPHSVLGKVDTAIVYPLDTECILCTEYRDDDSPPCSVCIGVHFRETVSCTGCILKDEMPRPWQSGISDSTAKRRGMEPSPCILGRHPALSFMYTAATVDNLSPALRDLMHEGIRG
jgi:hypothetical protein